MVRTASLIVSLIIANAIYSNSEELEELVVDPSWHGNRKPVLFLESPEIISDRNATVYALEEFCRSVGDVPAYPAEPCIERLNSYFNNVPIWRGTNTLVYSGSRAIGHFSPYDVRSRKVFYNEIDFAQEDVPTWGDIFDGDEEDRLKIVAGVFADNACLALRESGRIQPSYLKRCEARDLFKYARYLEGCITGFSRSSFINSARGNDGKSRYERARENMNRNEVVDERKGNGWKLVENYLLTIFTNQKCRDLHFVSMDNYIVDTPSVASIRSFDQLQEQLEPMYSVSIAIAARAGDRWAIQAYHEQAMGGDVAYWESVYEIDPILFHRWMASTVGRRWFENDERVLHAWQAYSLAKAFVPSLERVTFDRYFSARYGGFTDAEVKRAQSALKRGNWKSDLEYPWNRVPAAFLDIQRNIRRYEESKR